MDHLQIVKAIFRVQIVVPVLLQPMIGKKTLVRSLGTSDYDTALRLARPHIAEFKQRIASARLRYEYGTKVKPQQFNGTGFGNPRDGKHYWLMPRAEYEKLNAKYHYNYDPCPWPRKAGFDGLKSEWGTSNFVNPMFGATVDKDGRKTGITAWVSKSLEQHAKGKLVTIVYPLDKWLLRLLAAKPIVENLGDIRWESIEDGQPGKGTGRHIAAFTLVPKT
jgi:hypothetical protein